IIGAFQESALRTGVVLGYSFRAGDDPAFWPTPSGRKSGVNAPGCLRGPELIAAVRAVLKIGQREESCSAKGSAAAAAGVIPAPPIFCGASSKSKRMPAKPAGWSPAPAGITVRAAAGRC